MKTEGLTPLAIAEMEKAHDELRRDHETRKTCRTCRWYRRIAEKDQCARDEMDAFDVVNGPTKVLRDCYEYRRDFTEIGSHPLHNQCGYDARFWEPKPPLKMPRKISSKDFA